MDISELQIICSLTNYKNFNDAAYALSYSPSVITKYVKSVETELGFRLFIRSKKTDNMRLTPEGAVIMSAMRRISSDYNYMMELASQLKSEANHTIRIGSQPRHGNLHEQEILADFVMENPDIDLHLVKSVANSLMLDLNSGKLDAIFVTLHGDIDAQQYVFDHTGSTDICTEFLLSERDMFLGISDKYLPGKTEASFGEFRDFTFAFPFPRSPELQEVKAASTYDELAEKNGFQLKTVNINGFDGTVYKLAARMPLAICTINVPGQYDGIKFVKLKDWNGCTNLYFMYRKSNRNEILKKLRRCVTGYAQRLPDMQKPIEK